MSVELAAPETARRIEPRLHTAFGGVPYFDAELNVPQSRAHQLMVYETGNILQDIAAEAGLLFLSDHPIWYLHPESDEQRVYFGDWVIGVGGPERVTAEDLRIVIEVVTVSDRRKEIKDMGFQRVLNEYNAVPEFGLVFPERADARALTWCVLEGAHYRAVDVAPGGSISVLGVPGLELRVKDRAEWAEGRKIAVYYLGERRFPLTEERARAKRETARADQETARADQETARAEQASARAEQASARAERERVRAEQESQRAARLAEKLRAAGIDPNGDG